MAESSNKATPHWSSIKEVGTLFGLRFLWLVHRLFGRKMVSILLMPTVAYFLLFKPLARNSSLQYLTNHFRAYPNYWSARPGWRQVATHLRQFAETVVDKLLSWFVEIDTEQFDIKDVDYIEQLMADPRGQLIIGSHFGNLEYCRGFVHRYRNKIINILVHDKHSENYNTIMRQLNPDSRLHILQVSEFDIPNMLKIKSKIDNGEWVFIAGDRVPLSGAKRAVEVDFMGRKAFLPTGPYLLAKGLACPVQLMFTSNDYVTHNKKNGDNKIRVDVINFADPVTLDRRYREQQLQAYAQRFAKQLEMQCAHSPYQWFNFYDFWASPETPVAVTSVKGH